MKPNYLFLLVLALLSFVSVEGCEMKFNELRPILHACQAQNKGISCKNNDQGVCECKCVDK